MESIVGIVVILVTIVASTTFVVAMIENSILQLILSALLTFGILGLILFGIYIKQKCDELPPQSESITPGG